MRLTQQCLTRALVALLALAPAAAQAQANALDAVPIDAGVIESNERLIELPLDEKRSAGIVVDQTVTQVGRGFAEAFTTLWRSLGNTADHSIAISERPSARFGSLITVDQGTRRVYQTFLYPGRTSPRLVGESAALFVQQRIAAIEAENVLFSDPDIAKEVDM